MASVIWIILPSEEIDSIFRSPSEVLYFLMGKSLSAHQGSKKKKKKKYTIICILKIYAKTFIILCNSLIIEKALPQNRFLKIFS